MTGVAAVPIPTTAMAAEQAGAGYQADQSASAVSFQVPVPPSTNALFRNVPGQGRVKAGKYDDYIRMAVSAIRRQRVRGIEGNIIALVGVERPNLGSDIDNRLKGIMDAIVKAGVIADDRFVTAIAITWSPPANGLAHVILMPVGPACIEFHPARNGASGAWVFAPFQQKGGGYGDIAQ